MTKRRQGYGVCGRQYLAVFATISVIGIGHIQSRPTATAQENPFTGTSFRINSDEISVSSRGFDAGARSTRGGGSANSNRKTPGVQQLQAPCHPDRC